MDLLQHKEIHSTLPILLHPERFFFLNFHGFPPNPFISVYFSSFFLRFSNLFHWNVFIGRVPLEVSPIKDHPAWLLIGTVLFIIKLLTTGSCRLQNKRNSFVVRFLLDKLWWYGVGGRWRNEIIMISNAYIRKSSNSTLIIIVGFRIKTTTYLAIIIRRWYT